MAGILPFGAVFIELFFIFNALWENQFYYLFGFLFLVFCILVISVSQISIVLTYFQLCGEVHIYLTYLLHWYLFADLNFVVCLIICIVWFQDYHWWWKSFIISGGSAVYILIYSIFYFFNKLEITEFIPTLLYIGYTGILFSFYVSIFNISRPVRLHTCFIILRSGNETISKWNAN